MVNSEIADRLSAKRDPIHSSKYWTPDNLAVGYGCLSEAIRIIPASSIHSNSSKYSCWPENEHLIRSQINVSRTFRYQ